MNRNLLLVVVVVALLKLISTTIGYQAAYRVSYGTFTILAAMISLTFLWLWMRRETTLAFGMGTSWAGAACVMGWWWVYNALGRPAAMNENHMLFAMLGVYFSGAIMHFLVIVERVGLSQRMVAMPVGIAVLIAAAVEVASR